MSSPRIHVLEVVGNAIVGGMEKCVERLVERLPRNRFSVTALCPFESAFTVQLRKTGIEVLVTPMPEDLSWTSIQMTAALVKARGVNLLHAHLPNAHLLAAMVGRLTETPVLTTIHGRQVTLVDLEVHRAANTHLSVVCQQSYLHALGLGIAASHLSHEPNGVDTEMFQPRSSRKAKLRAALGLHEETPLVGFIGRLSPEKGPEVFVRAAMLLKSRCPDARCVMIGDGPMKRHLQDLIEQYELAEHLFMIGQRPDMPAVYNELDLVVSSSHSEAMPLALMEAMSSGLPVIATRVGGVPDLVEDGRTGWLVGPSRFDEIADRCELLLSDDGLRHRIGMAARERAVEQLGIDRHIERMAQLMQRLSAVEIGSVERPVFPVPADGDSATPLRRTAISANGRSTTQ